MVPCLNGAINLALSNLAQAAFTHGFFHTLAKPPDALH
jgi:hypothetical protein